MKEPENVKFKELLDFQYNWPSKYVFKFIVPRERVSELKLYLNTTFKTPFDVQERPSKTGKYISCIAHATMKSSDDILDVYKKVGNNVDGVLSL